MQGKQFTTTSLGEFLLQKTIKPDSLPTIQLEIPFSSKARKGKRRKSEIVVSPKRKEPSSNKDIPPIVEQKRGSVMSQKRDDKKKTIDDMKEELDE